MPGVSDEIPPNTATFDASKSQPLHPSRRALVLETPTPVPSSVMGTEIRDLASLLLVQAVRDMRSNTPMALAVTPARHGTPDVQVAPPTPTHTPSKLSRFLAYAETNLGVRNAAIYEGDLRRLGVGPDIIDQISDEILLKVGFSIGDVIRLKNGGLKWWLGPDAKRKRGEGSATDILHPKKKMFYEMRYKDGGAKRFSAPAMKVADEGSGNAETDDYTLYYELSDQRIWLPVPYGYEVIVDQRREDDEVNDKDPFN